MTPEVNDLITGLLKEAGKYIEVADSHHITAKQEGQVRIKMCDNNWDIFIETLHNILLTTDL